jgi:hypothetical protein
MTAAADTEDTATLGCTVETEIPTARRLRAQLMGLGYFIGRHRDEEALGFAPDKQRIHSSPQGFQSTMMP